VWHQIHRDNHLRDCKKIQLVAGYLLASQLKAERPAELPARKRKHQQAPNWVMDGLESSWKL
jgi:hypothetical protein